MKNIVLTRNQPGLPAGKPAQPASLGKYTYFLQKSLKSLFWRLPVGG